MDELYVPPSFVIPGMKKTVKIAWDKNASKQTDKRIFYPEFYKFAKLFQIFGFFPVHMTKLSSDLDFSWTSFTTISSVLVLPVAQIVFVKVFPLEIFEKLCAYVSVLVPLVINILYIYKLPTFIKLIQLMDSIDTNHCLKPGNTEETLKNNRFVLGILLFSTFIAIFPFHFLLYGFRPEVVVSYVCRIHRVFVKIMETCFIYVVCYQLIVLYNRFHASLSTLEERPCDEVTEQMVEDHRLVHAQLVRCVRLLDRSFGFWLMVIYIATSVQFVKSCYFVMYGDMPLASATTTLNISWTLIFVFYPAVLTDRIYNKSKDTIHFTFRMALKPYSEDVLFQIYYFMRQVKINVAAVSAGGLADVNKEIITKGLSIFATFFIATIQLEPQVELLIDSAREWLNKTEVK